MFYQSVPPTFCLRYQSVIQLDCFYYVDSTWCPLGLDHDRDRTIRRNAFSWQPSNVDGPAHCSAAECCGGNDSGDGGGKGYHVHCVLTPTCEVFFLEHHASLPRCLMLLSPLLSVLCFAYIGQTFLMACIQSIRSQRHCYHLRYIIYRRCAWRSVYH